MKDERFMDLKVPVFHNKRNGQMTIIIPKKQLKKIAPNKKLGIVNVRIKW